MSTDHLERPHARDPREPSAGTTRGPARSDPARRRTPRGATSPVKVLVVSGQSIVIAGVVSVMAGVPHVTVRPGSARSCASETPDVVVYDVSGLAQGHREIDSLVRQPGVPVLALTFAPHSVLGRVALGRGADSLLPPGWPAARMRDAIIGTVEAARGTQAGGFLDRRPAGRASTCELSIDDWHLTPREIEVLRLIAAGLTNTAIADQLFLSINSVKTYIRSAYRRLGVEHRSQAVAWCYQYGLGEGAAVVARTPTPTG